MATDEGAAQYMDTYGEGPGTETRKIIGEFINDDESVLDVGCGPGWNMDHFEQCGPQVRKYKGVDYSERFVRVANARRRENRFPVETYLPFELQDCRDLKEPKKSWDVVVVQDCLEHTNGYKKPVMEALRVARRRVIIVFWRTFNTSGQDDINDDGDDGYGATYDEGMWRDFLNSLPYVYFETETSPQANRWHKYFVIDKELK